MRFSPVVLSVDAEDNQTILHENVDPREEKINFGVSLRRIRCQGGEIHAEPSFGDFISLAAATRRQRSPPLPSFLLSDETSPCFLSLHREIVWDYARTLPRDGKWLSSNFEHGQQHGPAPRRKSRNYSRTEGNLRPKVL